jgi:hypothetical protein
MFSRTSGQRSTVESDLRWRDAILAGDEAAWHRFVHRYSESVVETAVRWCDLGCRFPTGCSLKRGGGSSFQRFLHGDCRCDRVGTAYCFILEKLREKLAFYRGERGCRLDTWVGRMLVAQPRHSAALPGTEYGYRQLYADYVRKVEGRIRAPAEILKREPLLEQVYLLHHYGRDDAGICEALNLMPAELDRAVERIEDALRRKGAEFFWRFWGHLWVPREADSLAPTGDEEEDEAPDPPSPAPDPHTEWEAGAVQAAIRDALEGLSPLVRHVLRLSIDEGRSAAEIAAELRALDLAAWTPRQVYGEIDRALGEICRRVTRLLAPVDEVTVNPRRMKRVLEFWSVGRFLSRGPTRRRIAP